MLRSGQSSREDINQMSIYNKTQISGFARNGKVDLHQCLDEVNRRASETGYTDFHCSIERFTALAMENGSLINITPEKIFQSFKAKCSVIMKMQDVSNMDPKFGGWILL